MKRTVLITGGAKRLGAALARGLAKDGHRVAIHFRTSRREAEETREAIRVAGGESALFASPLASLDDGQRLVEEVLAHFGELDTLINNAGVFNQKRFEELTQAEWEEGFASTAGAAFYATRAALASLRGSSRGRIVNIGDSMATRIGFTEPAMSHYIGKAGVWMMTQTLAYTEAPHGLTVNLVSPGVLPESICFTPVGEMPMGRYNSYEDILHPVRFLLEEASAAVTGSHLQAGGGWNMAPLFPTVLSRSGYTRPLPPGTT